MTLTGGCLCGTVRYALNSDPADRGWCHCRTCQLHLGAPALAFASVPVGDFQWTAGADIVHWVKSSSFGRRAFCGNCGTPLQIHVDHQADIVDFPIVTLDDPDPFAPEFHIFWDSKVAWFDPGGDLPKNSKFRPGTIGLDGTDPPDQSALSGGGGG